MSSRPSASVVGRTAMRGSISKADGAATARIVSFTPHTIRDFRFANNRICVLQSTTSREIMAGMTDAEPTSPQLDAPRRRELALALVAERGFVRVAELSRAFGVTTVTARADLDALERQGGIRRVHGGAVPATSVIGADRPEREPSFEEALEASVEPKRRIGEHVASL